MTILMCAQKLTDASLIYHTVPKTKTSNMKKLKKQKNTKLRKLGKLNNRTESSVLVSKLWFVSCQYNTYSKLNAYSVLNVSQVSS